MRWMTLLLIGLMPVFSGCFGASAKSRDAKADATLSQTSPPVQGQAVQAQLNEPQTGFPQEPPV